MAKIPKGLKRKLSSDASPMAGKSSKSKLVKFSSVVAGGVAMTKFDHNQNKTSQKKGGSKIVSNNERPIRKSNRIRRQIKFENGERKVIAGVNNNAKPCEKLDLKNVKQISEKKPITKKLKTDFMMVYRYQ